MGAMGADRAAWDSGDGRRAAGMESSEELQPHNKGFFQYLLSVLALSNSIGAAINTAPCWLSWQSPTQNKCSSLFLEVPINQRQFLQLLLLPQHQPEEFILGCSIKVEVGQSVKNWSESCQSSGVFKHFALVTDWCFLPAGSDGCDVF